MNRSETIAMTPHRRLDEVLGATSAAGAGAPQVRVGRHIIAASEACFLSAAAALVVARLTGRRHVRLAIVQSPVQGPVGLDVELPDETPAAQWLAATETIPAGDLEGAELLLAHSAADAHGLLVACPKMSAVIAIDADALLVYSDCQRIDSLAADCLLAAMARACHVLATCGDTALGNLSILSPCERANLLCRYQNARVRRPRGQSLVDRMQRIVERWPEQTALADHAGRLSYAEMWRRSAAIATALHAAGVQAGDTVGVHGQRSVDHVLAVLAIVRAGAAWLALDEGLPPARINLMLGQAAARCVIVCDGSVLPAQVHTVAVSLQSLEHAAAAPLPPLAEDACACVIYVSGANGHPEAIEIAHRSLLRALCDPEYIHIAPGSTMLHASPIGVDASLCEIFGPLLNGGTCYVHDEILPTPAGLARSIRHGSANLGLLTAPLFECIIDEDPQSLAGLRQLVITGPVLSVDSVRHAQSMLPALELVRAWGHGECAVLATAYPVPNPLPAGCQVVPVGLPVAETSVHVLAADGGLLPIGAIGEIHIGGCGVALGYREQSSGRECFIADPYGDKGDRLFRTGDHGRRLEDGNIALCGRIDGQLWLNGFRVERAEVEQALRQASGLSDVAVVLRVQRPRQPRMVAYLCGAGLEGAVAPPRTIEHGRLRSALAERLPAWMIPSAFVAVQALPLDADGRPDLRLLPAPDSARPRLAQLYEPPVGSLERHLCTAFADTIGTSLVGRHDNFFELGGDSLQAVRLLSLLRREGAPELTVSDLMRAPTPARLARGIGERQARAARHHRQQSSRRASHDAAIAVIAIAARLPEDGGGDIGGRLPSPVEATADRHGNGSAASRSRKVELISIEPPASTDGALSMEAGLFGMGAAQLAALDPRQRLFLQLCWESMEQGGHAPGDVDGDGAGQHRTSVFAGAPADAGRSRMHQDAPSGAGANGVMAACTLASLVAHALDLHGPATSVQAGDATVLAAIAQAFDSLRAGHCDRALAGAVYASTPDQAAADHAGVAAAVVLLRRLDDALADGDPVHVVIRGAAVGNAGGAWRGRGSADADGQADVLRRALDMAGVDAGSISYIETHAAGDGEAIDTSGLSRAIREHTTAMAFCTLNPVGSDPGAAHAGGAAGLLQIARALSQEQFPPARAVAAVTAPGDADTPFIAHAEPCPWPRTEGLPRRAVLGAFGPDGTHAQLVLEEPPLRASPAAGGHACVLQLAAPTMAARSGMARRLGEHLRRNPQLALADIAHTLRVGRRSRGVRGTVVACSVTDAALQLQRDSMRRSRAHDVQTRPAARDVVFMFPGNGTQYPGMGRGLYRRDPVFRAAFDACALALREAAGVDLREAMRDPAPGRASPLPRPAVAEPALFALEYALARTWMAAGIRPAALIGHGLGEFTAAAIGGVMSPADAIRVLARRGELLQHVSAGAMLAVGLSCEALRQRLPPSLEIAADNAPNWSVASGPVDMIADLRVQLAADGVGCRRLPVARAHHSWMMAPLLPALSECMGSIPLRAPRIPIVSTITGVALGNVATDPGYWTVHCREPVQFRRALSGLLGAGHLLLEVGPRDSLSALARRQVADRRAEPQAQPSLQARPESEWRALLLAAGAIWREHLPVDIGRFDTAGPRQRLCLPGFPFSDPLQRQPRPAVAPAGLVASASGSDTSDSEDMSVDRALAAAASSRTAGDSGQGRQVAG
jgi:amino acid adenylation domain-containing protein